MSKNTESAIERLERLKKEKAAEKEASKEETGLVSQLTHQSDGEPDFKELAEKLKERQEAEKETSSLAYTVKYTLYVQEDVAAAFNALCTKRGDQRKFANQALKDFVAKKVKELGLDK